MKATDNDAFDAVIELIVGALGVVDGMTPGETVEN